MKAYLYGILACSLVCPNLAGEQIRIIVLNTKNGKPIANETITYLESEQNPPPGDSTLYRDLKTDVSGSAVLNLHGRGFIYATAGGEYENCSDQWEFSLSDVLQTGIVAKPRLERTWCHPVRFRIESKPGTLVLFVQKPSWWQKSVGS